MDIDRIKQACADVESCCIAYDTAMLNWSHGWEEKRKAYNTARRNLELVVMDEYTKSKGK
jgi:hypothetical protein